MFKQIKEEDRRILREKNYLNLKAEREKLLEEDDGYYLVDGFLDDAQLYSLVDRDLKKHECVIPGTNISYQHEVEDMCERELETNKIIALDENYNIIGNRILTKGSKKSIEYDFAAIAEYLLSMKAKFYIHVHNHPEYYGQDFSLADYIITFRIARFTEQMGIHMVDAVICSEFDFVSLIQNGDMCRGTTIIHYDFPSIYAYEAIQSLNICERQYYTSPVGIQYLLMNKKPGLFKLDTEGDYSKWVKLTESIMMQDKELKKKIVSYFEGLK